VAAMTFSAGDCVIYANQHKAVVISKVPGWGLGSDEYLIAFADTTLIPDQMTVSETLLVLYGTSFGSKETNHCATISVNKETNCPNCHEKWTITQGLNEKWHDCLRCKTHREDVWKE
jgi:hypothetical protein